MGIPKTVDITKLQPFNWKWLVALILVVVIIGSVVSIGMWLKDKVTAQIPVGQEPVL